MPIDFYYGPHSSPCRAIIMVAEALNVELNFKLLSTMEGQHMTPEFLKINPQHTIPTIVDNGFALWESRAIITYLVNKYGKGSSLYPEDPQARAVVDQRLYFDISTLNQRFSDYMFQKQPADEAKLKKTEEALEFLEKFLEGHDWVAGDQLTLADISIVSTVTVFSTFDIDIFKYPNIKAWYARAKANIPGFDKNEEGAAIFAKWYERVRTAPGFNKGEEGAKMFGNLIKEMTKKK